MANKLNAFLASVPANGLPSPVGLKGSAGTPTPLKAPVFPELSLKAPEESEASDSAAAATPRKGDGIRAVQPAIPQPQKQRRHANRRNNKSFERHFSTSDSARNTSFPPGNEKNRVGNGNGNGDDDDNVDNGSSNQEEIEQHKQQQQHAMTPLKAFTPKQQQQKTGGGSESNKQQQQLIPNESEAGPLRRLSAQGSHHRRVSTDTTMFNRYLRQQADRDINMDVVQHFSGVPVVTISRSSASGGASSTAFDTKRNSEPRNNNDEDSVDNNISNDCCTIDPNAILAVFRRGGAVSTASALEILKQATDLMSLEQNVIAVQAPYTLVGDLHGQFQDLLEIFQVHGVPSATNPFLFLGDYVDRGISSCEVVLLLLAFKVTFPTSVHMLRGNHECRSLSTFYGFRAECLRKYGTLVYNRMVKCFESMPLAAKLETSYGTFLAVHGGLSPEIGHIEDINEQVNRFMEPEPNGALCDLLWADPAKESSSQDEEWRPNSVRGCSFTFNERACREFLKRNELLAIIRAHELEEDGFREHFNASQREEKSSSDADEDDSESGELLAIAKLPPVITVFSAPEYCNTNHNMGATLVVPWEKRANVLEFRQHKRSVHREHEFELPSEDQAVKDFLKEALPFLPVDFYELIMHCRQLKQMLMLSSQSSSMSQLLPLPAMGFGTLPLAETSGNSSAGHTGKSAFALEIGAVSRRPSDVVVSSSKSHASESEDLQARSGRSTTEERSVVDREETEEDVLSAELGRLSSSSSRQKRRKQQQKSKQDGPEAQVPAAATKTAAVQSPNGNVQVLTCPPPASAATAHHAHKSPPRSNNRTILGGWKLCPGFLRFCDRTFGSKTNSATDLRSSVPAVVLETGDSEDVDSNNRRASLTTEPMNNQLNSSEDPGSPVAAVSPSSSLTALSATGAQLPPLSQQHNHTATDSVVPMQLESLFPGHKPKGSEVFSELEWQALKLYFTLLDVSGNGVLMEESFIVLLAEQDSDAYATEDELTLLMEVIDTNADGLITEQDFLLFAYRSYLRWKKSHKKLGV